MSCVRPGCLLTKAKRLWFASVLRALDLPAFERPAAELPSVWSSATPPGTALGARWWSLYNDKALDTLVDEALQHARPRRVGLRCRCLRCIGRVHCRGTSGQQAEPGSEPHETQVSHTHGTFSFTNGDRLSRCSRSQLSRARPFSSLIGKVLTLPSSVRTTKPPDARTGAKCTSRSN